MFEESKHNNTRKLYYAIIFLTSRDGYHDELKVPLLYMPWTTLFFFFFSKIGFE